MNKIFKYLILFFALLISSSHASSQSSSPIENNLNTPFGLVAGPMPVEQAFQVSIEQTGDNLEISFAIQPGYKLYKDKININGTEFRIENFDLPKGVMYNDPEFGNVEVYTEDITLNLTLASALQRGILSLHYQGCTTGLCYPPQEYQYTLNKVEKSNSAYEKLIIEDAESSVDDIKAPDGAQNENTGIAWSLVTFLLIGLGLALTPCVFPMYPILSTIVVGDGERKSLKRTLWLSILYVQGMAIVYSLMGVLVALAGLKFQIWMQHPFVIGTVCFLFILFALSMFGVITIQPPASYQTAVSSVSNKQKGGTSLGAFGMGTLAGLVASPCTTAPLAGILMYIANTGDILKGFTSLYALSLGMGIPLIVFALTGGALLNKAKPYMNFVKNIFGFALLGMAIYFSGRFLSSSLVNDLYALLGIVVGIYIIFSQARKPKNGFKKLIFCILAILTIMGSTVMLTLKHSGVEISESKIQEKVEFEVVSSQLELESALLKAKKESRPVMIDLYASWCTACIQFEKYTFRDDDVANRLNDFKLLKIDMTKNSDFGDDIQNKYGVVGLPSILLFDKNGVELKSDRVTGYLEAPKFLERIDKM